jgi:hypothetical protein
MRDSMKPVTNLKNNKPSDWFIIKYFFLLVLSVSFISCKESSNPIVEDLPFKYPLQAGYSWTYSVSIKYSNFSSPEVRNYINDTSYTLIVTADTAIEINGTTAYRLMGNYYSSLDNGYFLVASEMGDTYFQHNPPMMEYPHPMKVGDKWFYINSEYLRPTVEKEVLGIEMVNTGTLNLSCYKIKLIYDIEILKGVYEYAGSKGLVKKVYVMPERIFNPDDSSNTGWADLNFEMLLKGTNF